MAISQESPFFFDDGRSIRMADIEASEDQLITDALEARDKGNLGEAFVSLSGILSTKPDHPRARILLSQIFYLLDCTDLALGEVTRLQEKYPDRESLYRLRKALDPSFSEDRSVGMSKEKQQGDLPVVKTEPVSQVIAETDFDLDDIDLLDQ